MTYTGGGSYSHTWLLVGVFGVCLAARAQQAAPPEAFDWSMPLLQVAEKLEQVYAKPVTYDDPSRLSRSEMEVAGTLAKRGEQMRVKRHRLVLPPGSRTDEVAALDITLLNRILDAYHQQNPDQARFRVIQSEMGFHIVPAQIHDQAGRLVAATDPLDAYIAVDLQKRTASEHLKAICDAVSAATGTPVESYNPNFNGFYAANGYLLPGIPTGGERPYMLFDWGVTRRTARDALINLMEGSASTMSWTLRCGPTSGHAQNGCIFQMEALQVGPTRKILAFDRCPNCRPIPKQ